MVETERSVIFQTFKPTDHASVAALWTRINRELAPAGMEDIFEQYIARTIKDELACLSEVFSDAKRNAFWIVKSASRTVGCFGIESHSESDAELRRMYLDKEFRGLGIAQRMLHHAQDRARALGFNRMLVSTAEIQTAANKFYRKNGFQQIRVEVAETMTTKQAGGGLIRFHFVKAI